jgi:hypothetical protein
MHTRQLMTLFGPVKVCRLGYSARGTTSRHPLDTDLNLPKDRYSLGVLRQAAEQAAKNSFDETALALCTTTAAEVPKRQLEQIVARASTDFDAFYVERQAHALSNAAEAGPILVLSMDGKGVVMRKQDLREPTRRKAEQRCAQYLLNHKAYLRYDEYLGAGFPIATGVIEGACRHVVKDRMDLTGARWSLGGAEAILRLRSLRASGDFDQYWRFHEQQEQRRNHTALYADANVPPPRPIPRPHANARGHLRLVS